MCRFYTKDVQGDRIKPDRHSLWAHFDSACDVGELEDPRAVNLDCSEDVLKSPVHPEHQITVGPLYLNLNLSPSSPQFKQRLELLT
jgi:hypothetical protein